MKIINNPNSTLIDRLEEKVKHALEWLSIIFLLLQVIVVVIVVFGRFILNKTPVWGEEISLLAMIWLSLLSAVMAEMDSSHIKLTIIDKFLSEKIRRIRDMVFNFMNTIFSLILVVEGFKLAFKLRSAVMPGSRLPVWVLYLSVPISSIFLFFTILKKITQRKP